MAAVMRHEAGDLLQCVRHPREQADQRLDPGMRPLTETIDQRQKAAHEPLGEQGVGLNSVGVSLEAAQEYRVWP